MWALWGRIHNAVIHKDEFTGLELYNLELQLLTLEFDYYSLNNHLYILHIASICFFFSIDMQLSTQKYVCVVYVCLYDCM